ncbi:nitroreductase family protein [Parabacteroides bouchesdurhonensis]|uniref:nitroreductase family protein n=1 Tax=Parabacteroides bouchesdurhonensis TaxID=1936995 RepID=UPI000C85DBF2|nr:nitroreductase family protein [Parabacteroides bouchesdurhonensis]RHJ92561.1 NAD(P)H nitroreductase [Bacteroides sp. AM07-16]
MESFATLIANRRSTRKFTDQLLSPEQVELILKAALMAPASKRSNPWQFVVVEDKEMLKTLARCKANGSSFLEGCALAIVVLANVMESEVWIEDASIASIYMQLQAEDLGLGSCWCQIRNRQTEDEMDSSQYVRNVLNIPYQLEVLSIIGIGYKDQVRKPFDESHLQWEKIHLGTYKVPEEKENNQK